MTVCSQLAQLLASPMPNGLTPTYGYKPHVDSSAAVKMRVVSARRGRLFAGGTYFRSIDSGRTANNITVQIVKEGSDAYLIVTNYNLSYQENVLGPAGLIVKVLDMSGSNWNDLVRIDQLNEVSPRTQQYSISCSIAFARQNGQLHSLPAPTTTTAFQLNRLVSLSGKLAVKIEKSAAIFTQSSVISITPRFKIYKLLALSIAAATDPVTTIATPAYDGYDIVNMRTQVNASKMWVAMLERSGTQPTEPGATPSPPAIKFDQQDDDIDQPVASIFTETNLAGGDGLPDGPTAEKTGPSRSIILVNYGEKYDGSLDETNTIYEWVGDSVVIGEWKTY